MLNIIAIFIFLLVLGLSINTVRSAENYNSSKSNTVTSVAKVHEYVGNILLPYGVGGMEINRVNDALDVGITGDALKAMLGEILGNVGLGTASGEGVSDKVQAILLEFDKIGIGEEGAQEVSTPGAGGAVPSAADGTIRPILPSGISPSKRAEPVPAVTTPTSSLTNTTAVKNIELMRNTIGKIQERLKSCDNAAVCDIVERHAKGRLGLTDTTKKAIENRNWEEATRLLREVRDIVVGDIELLEGAEDRGSIADVLGLERALLRQTDSALKEMSALKPVTPRKGGFIKLGDLPGKRVTFEDSTTKSIQDLKAAESKEERENIREELKASRQTLQENTETLRKDLRENAKELRDNFRENVKTTIGHVDYGKTGRIALAHGKGLRMVNRYRSAIARFGHILGRMESRVQKLEERGADVSSITALIEEAKNMSVENKAKLEELKAKYESLLEGKNPGRVAEEAREIAKELKAEIEKLRGLLDDIRQAASDYNTSISNSSSTL